MKVQLIYQLKYVKQKGLLGQPLQICETITQIQLTIIKNVKRTSVSSSESLLKTGLEESLPTNLCVQKQLLRVS